MTGQLASFHLDGAEVLKITKRFPELAANNLTAKTRQMLGGFRKRFIAQLKTSGESKKQGKSTIASQWYWKASKRGTPLDLIEGEFWTDSRAAQGWEIGGTIRSKSGKRLIIPLSYTKTKTGRTKKRFAAQRRQTLQALKSKKRLVQVHRNSPLGRALEQRYEVVAYQRVGGKKKFRLIPLYAFPRQIKLRPRLGMFEAFRKYEQTRGVQLLGEAIKATLEGRKLAFTEGREPRPRRRSSR